MKSIDLAKLPLAAPPRLRELLLDPSKRTSASCCRLVPVGVREQGRLNRPATDRLLQGLLQLTQALGLTELLCFVDGNQAEDRAQPWLAGLPPRRDRIRSLLGRLLKELKEGQNFDGLIRLHQPDIPRWLPVLARRALKHSLPATLCVSREPLLLIAVEPAGELRCYSPEEAVLEQVAALAPAAGLQAATLNPAVPHPGAA